MVKQTKKDSSFVIKCSHCLNDDFKLDDVNHEDEIKFYTDTPFKFKLQDATINDQTTMIQNVDET